MADFAALTIQSGTTKRQQSADNLIVGAGIKPSSGSAISINSNTLTNVVDPTSAQDAATKNYVDAGDHVLLPEVWERVSLASSLTNSIVNANVNTTRDTLVMIRAGVITGIRVDLDTAVAAGTATFKVSKNGSATALTLSCSSGSNASGGSATNAGISFAAGDTIGVLLDTTSGLTAGINASVWVQIRPTA